MNNQPKILVAGMHRSQTSLVCQWLQDCGLQFGNQLMKGDFANRYGYIENLNLVKLHQHVLDEEGVSVYPKRKIVFSENSKHYFKQNIKKIIYSENINAFKDPRATLFLEDFWVPMVDNLFVILCYRNPYEVIQSLINREEKHAEHLTKTEKFIWQSKWLISKKKWTNRFVNAYILYNNAVLNMVKNYPKKTLLLNKQTCLVKDKAIISKINNFGFSLENKSFKNSVKSVSSHEISLSLSAQQKNELDEIYAQLYQYKFQ